MKKSRHEARHEKKLARYSEKDQLSAAGRHARRHALDRYNNNTTRMKGVQMRNMCGKFIMYMGSV